MRVNATIEVSGAFCRMWLTELAGVGSRQVAERDRVVSRLYDAVLDRDVQLTIGLPYWVTDEYGRNVMYPAYQEGRSVRFHRRDGEFYPGLVLERLGMYEGGIPGFLTGGDGWFVGGSPTNVFRTVGLDVYESVPALRAKHIGPIAIAGKEVVLGGFEKLYYSSDGQTWGEFSLAGYDEVMAIVFDGANVVAACRGGIAIVSWYTDPKGIVWFKQPGTYIGLSAEFDNAEPFRVKPGASAGVWEILNAGEGVFRTLGSVEAPYEARFSNNFVRYDRDNRFIVVDDSGVVWSFGQDDLQAIGQMGTVGPDPSAQASYPVRDIVLLVGRGRLGWTDGAEVHEVYDFGGEVLSWPSLLGPVVVREDGLTYRLRRISYGL